MFANKHAELPGLPEQLAHRPAGGVSSRRRLFILEIYLFASAQLLR